MLLILLAAACSDDGESGEEANGDESAASTAAPVNCPGEPVKLMTFAALTGAPTGPVDEDQARIGIDAALTEINGTCSLGRPIEVTLCDDKFMVDGSLA
ncbi:MAG TPA: hypothetical protein VJM33_16805, partial [Microthrixaceae bacterium]|nr:hypothetical protein [Microthrixaceae bacterium]